ncbi:alkaline shock protein [Fructilactobacillus florum 8D]|uniref:Alkaline shock protein n=2 Tax=Fructilactobacillus florum TaxID=640331 RepID=W9EDM6_9LACO|nr:Asp23/Gls24 family envelope stress response protein [Fructilactobacillus florum]EKK20716.1 alkaline shock protein [Fructilactobacillus florum 2F]ETO40182.1 alkaline shock protein [Fructilactobacillus florum 8D]KRM91800.1 hypothetical protein FC87_GL000624 [Fructilactobacillus florum DSM 22689 = JCM 16035]
MAADEQFMKLTTKENDLGQIEVAPQVIEVIAGIAANHVEGVNRMQGTFSASVKGIFGRKERSQGITLRFDEDQNLNVDVFVYLDYGVSVPKIALKIQDQVRQQLLFMTDLQVATVNVHVEGIVPEKTPKVDLDQLFTIDGGDREN